MKDRYVLIITTLCILLFICFVLGFILIEITNDLRATANGYESDRNICRREYEELVENYKELEKQCN
jgi:hypothetical protein